MGAAEETGIRDMIKRPTAFLLIAFVLLGALAWWIEQNPSVLPQSGTATPTSIPSPLANWDIAGTRMIQYVDPASGTLTLRLGKDFTDWSIDEISGAKADAGKVMQLLSELKGMQPLQELISISSKEAMGLDSGAGVIKLVDKSDNEIQIILGNQTPISSGSYIKAGEKYYIINIPVIDNVTGLLTLDGIVKATETPVLDTQTPQP